jgi:hypothetical protein
MGTFTTANRTINARPVDASSSSASSNISSLTIVVVRPWRTRQEASSPALTPAQLARLLLQPAARLTAAAQGTVEDVLQANPLLGYGYQLCPRFQTLLAERDLPALEPWRQAAETSALPG